jgi:murein DD-endopeptidase MepM/ murein hydrolase activator NlpD
VQDLKSKEGKLLADIEKNRKVTARINKAISDLIEREMAKAAKAAEEEAKKNAVASGVKPAKTDPRTGIKTGSSDVPAVNDPNPRSAPKPRAEVNLMLTPEDMELANSFEGSRGRMYWPVEKGYIIDHFGVHPHPLAPKVMIDQAGADIQTSENARVRCVFNGTVKAIFSVTGGISQCVMVQHGNYFTVYSGLSSVNVRKDQELSPKETIGVVGINDEGLPVVNFQIWKSAGKGGNVKLNPEQWLARVH